MTLAAVLCASFVFQPSLSGSLIVLNKAENTSTIVDLKTRKNVITFATGIGPNEVMVSPSGKVAVISNMGDGRQPDKTLTVVDMPSGANKRTIDLGEQGRPHGIAFLSETKILVTSHATDSLFTLDLPSGKIEAVISSGGKGTHFVALSNDKKTAYTSNAFSNTVSFYDLASSKLTAQVTCGERAEGLSLSPDNKTLACGNVGGNSVTILDAKSGKLLKTLPNTAVAIRTFWTKDGASLMVSCAGTGEIAVFDTKTWEERTRIKLAEQAVKFDLGGQPNLVPMNYADSGDSRYVFVVMVASNAVAVIDTKDWKVVDKVNTGKIPDGIAWSPLGS